MTWGASSAVLSLSSATRTWNRTEIPPQCPAWIPPGALLGGTAQPSEAPGCPGTVHFAPGINNPGPGTEGTKLKPHLQQVLSALPQPAPAQTLDQAPRKV